MARGIWKGTLGFGLVNIGVELFTADAPQGIDLDMLDARDHAPIGYRKYNKATGAEVASDDIVKGYAVAKGQYVILTPDDLTAASPKKSQSIDVLGFVAAADVPLVYFDKPYVIGPLKGSEKAYALFVRTLTELEQIGIAQVVIRTKQHMAAVYPYHDALVAQLLRYHEELRQPEQLGVERGLAQGANLRPQELQMAKQLVEMMHTEWAPEQYRDTYRDDLMRLIEERAAGESVRTPTDTGSAEPRVLDLVSALKGSLAARARDRVRDRERDRGNDARKSGEKTIGKPGAAARGDKVVKPARKVAASRTSTTDRAPRPRKTGS